MNSQPQQHRPSPVAIFLLVALVIVGAVTGAGHFLSMPALVGYFAGINTATVLLYGYDKAVAGGERLRVPENILHLLALFGGSPAAFLSQVLLRHKTVKPSFRRMFWLIVALQLAAVTGGIWCWFHPPAWWPAPLRSCLTRLGTLSSFYLCPGVVELLLHLGC
jgi:uncharacterized membrane protein YsdA (DUF1294 family)